MMNTDTEKKSSKTTLRSIARDLDMSVMTIVRTLNGNPRVSEHTRLKVMQRVKELGFDYRKSSRNARNERMQEVAVYCADEKFYGDNLFNFFMRLHYYCVRELKAHAMKATLLPQDLLNEPDPSALIKYGTLIILGPFLPGKDILKKWKKLYPELLIVSVLGDPLPVSTVDADDYGGGAFAARTLFGLGHHHIAVFSSMVEQPTQKRFAGFCGEYFRLDENVEIDRVVFPVKTDFFQQLSETRNVLDHYFSGRKREDFPTAFFVTNGYFSLVLADYLKEKSISVPDDISILGYDNLEAMAQYDPPIARIDFDLKSMAVKTVAFLCGDRTSGLPQNTQIIIENNFIPGKSLKDIKIKSNNKGRC